MRTRAFASPTLLAVVGAAAVFNAGLALILAHRGVSSAGLLALVPILLILFGLLVSSNRTVLLAAALGLSMTFPAAQKPIPLPFPGQLYWTDIVVFLALAAWLARRLTLPAELRPRSPATPLLGPPIVLFAAVTLWATFRGHYAYGTNLLGGPVRLFGYALLVFALVDLNPRSTYRTIVAVFYTGTVWMFLSAIYYFANGTSQTDQIDLSTGGKRVLALSTAIYLSGGLFLALLNLEIDRTAKRRAIHMLIAALALAGIVVAYGRATYIAVALVVPALFLLLPRLRSGLFSVLPICIPFIVLAAIALQHLAPTVGSTFSNRVLHSNSSDINIRWRKAAADALWQEVHQSPITGVGFGKTATLRFEGVPMTVDQDPHDSYLYLLAGGGILTLSGYLLLVLTFVVDGVRRLRQTKDPYQRLIIIWSMATLCSFLVNAAAGPVLSDPRMLLTIWAVMLLPSSIARSTREPAIQMQAQASTPQPA